MPLCSGLISNEGTCYQILEIVEDVVSLRPVGGGTIVAYKIVDIFARFETACSLPSKP
jgi:hypothetical protein